MKNWISNTLLAFFNKSSDEANVHKPLIGSRGTGPDISLLEDDDTLHKYPPFDKGIKVQSVDSIVSSQSDLIARIYRTSGVSREEFAARIEPVIWNLARHIHLLPATSTTYFRGAGGLFRFALEIGLYAMQSANSSIFPMGGAVERRYFLQPKWSLATFLAGLLCQLYRPINNMMVITRGNEQWSPDRESLYDWAMKANIDRYFIRWFEDNNCPGVKLVPQTFLYHIVPLEVREYLSEGNNQIMPTLSAAIASSDRDSHINPIYRIIAPVVTRVIEEDIKNSSENYGNFSVGFHLEPHLIDAMRQLIKNGTWAYNIRNGVVWVGTDGVFIDWNTAARDLVSIMTRDSFVGVPKDQDTLADLLFKASVFELTPTNSKYWAIYLPGTMEGREGMVKLTQPGLIFPQHFDMNLIAKESLLLGNPQTESTAPLVAQDIPLEKTHQAPAPEKQKRTPKKLAPAAIPTEVLVESETAENQDAGRPQKTTLSEKSVSTQSTSKEDPVSKAGDRMFALLKPENALLLREIVEHKKTEQLKGVVAQLAQGVGISHEELNAHGQPAMSLIEELAARQWLWVDNVKPTRKIHSIEYEGAMHKMLVIKTDVARSVGLCEAGG